MRSLHYFTGEMLKLLLFFLANCIFYICQAQGEIVIVILDQDKVPVRSATVELVAKDNNSLEKIQLSDSAGVVKFSGLKHRSYIAKVSYKGFSDTKTDTLVPGSNVTLTLAPVSTELSNVTVTARRSFIEMHPGKTVVNLDASTTSIGTNALEALEKLPGLTIDKDGNISIKGRTGVTVLIDGRQTYLDNTRLSTFLSGMSSSQISQVEIMDQPSSQYDAAGNAGVINIKTKKNQQRGFNGSVTTAYTQGVYPKNNNSLQLNYRSGKWNLFTNYSNTHNEQFTRVYALRSYFQPAGTIKQLLEQPTFMRSNANIHNLRAGVDYSFSSKTLIGLTLTATSLKRNMTSNNIAYWMNVRKVVDSSIITRTNSDLLWRNAGGNINVRHSFSSNEELTFDADVIAYDIDNVQNFKNTLEAPGGYSDATLAKIPSQLNIVSAKTDYSKQSGTIKWSAGAKTSHIKTDNLADYQINTTGTWTPDYGKSNHFLYKETIHAVYTNAEGKNNKWSWQTGLRYEQTSYNARQLGNVIQKDSSFSRSFGSLFPTFFATYASDSNNSFSLSAGRRIDRPGFQKLNPFVMIINKYTYQSGNPYYKPQFTWNFQLSHSYKNALMTSVGYSITTDYFSQYFPIDTGGVVIYTEGNLGKLQHFTFSVGANKAPTKWWSFLSQATLVHKKMEGIIGKQMSANITQLTINLNNQFRFSKGWSGELSGLYTSKSQTDIQEIVDPAGQLSVGISKAIMNNKGSIRLALRDIFYTQWMKGNTFFTNANEYFKLSRDTRVAAVSFTYRFGKTFKTNKRSEGAAGEEIQRVGNG